MAILLNTFLTVDTEIWPLGAGWPRNPLPKGKTDFSAEFDACIRGRTALGDYGIHYQTQLLNAHGLKAVYLVEPFFARVGGMPLLREIVEQVQHSGHEVGLHPHTEWLGEIKAPSLPEHYGPVIRGYSQDEQRAIIRYGLETLYEAGAQPVMSFRAGSYGANLDTLSALSAEGIRFDTSYNYPFPDSFPDWSREESLEQPRRVGDIWEFPVSNFIDYPGHLRHVQLCACSFREMRHTLLQAWREQRHAFVIVMHSFELVRRKLRRDGMLMVEPNPITIRRFKQLCRFLEAHQDKFLTRGFADLDEASIPVGLVRPRLQSTLFNTGLRQIEQVASTWI